jgi:hypothetical protein
VTRRASRRPGPRARTTAATSRSAAPEQCGSPPLRPAPRTAGVQDGAARGTGPVSTNALAQAAGGHDVDNGARLVVDDVHATRGRHLTSTSTMQGTDEMKCHGDPPPCSSPAFHRSHMSKPMEFPARGTASGRVVIQASSSIRSYYRPRRLQRLQPLAGSQSFAGSSQSVSNRRYFQEWTLCQRASTMQQHFPGRVSSDKKAQLWKKLAALAQCDLGPSASVS